MMGRKESNQTNKQNHSASPMMPNSDPQDGFFYPTLTLMIDSYNVAHILRANYAETLCLTLHERSWFIFRFLTVNDRKLTIYTSSKTR